MTIQDGEVMDDSEFDRLSPLEKAKYFMAHGNYQALERGFRLNTQFAKIDETIMRGLLIKAYDVAITRFQQNLMRGEYPLEIIEDGEKLAERQLKYFATEQRLNAKRLELQLNPDGKKLIDQIPSLLEVE